MIMNLYEKTIKLSAQDFKEIIGGKRSTFETMVDILKHAYNSRSQKYRGGRKKKLSVEEQLMLTLKYHRFYITQKALAFEFEIGEATVCDTIRWVEDILIKDGTFSLPGKKVLLEGDNIEVVLVDVTECPIERPKKQRKHYSGKKKRHTIKAQVVRKNQKEVN